MFNFNLGRKNITITTPKDMGCNVNKLIIEALSKFEKEFKNEEQGEEYYHLVIQDEYPREVCDEIEKIYKGVGWKNVKCKTSSENGERPGLTELELYA